MFHVCNFGGRLASRNRCNGVEGCMRADGDCCDRELCVRYRGQRKRHVNVDSRLIIENVREPRVCKLVLLCMIPSWSGSVVGYRNKLLRKETCTSCVTMLGLCA